MKYLLLCTLFYSASIFCQDLEYEKIAFMSFLQNKNSFFCDSSSCQYSKNLRQELQIDNFFSNRIWHRNGIVKNNAYTKSDSIKNLNFSSSSLILSKKLQKQFHVFENSTRKKSKKSIIFIEINKRFFYDNFVYVLILIKDTNYNFTDILYKFDINGKLVCSLSNSFSL